VLLLDVNVCLHGLRPDIASNGPQVRRWLEDALNGHERVGVSDVVLASLIRLATNARMLPDPLTPADALVAADALREAPASVWVSPTSRHWDIFARLISTHRLRVNDIPDAWLAALALDHGATLVTLDRGFARFEGLRTHNPLA
jgi:uncharacterized protein